MNSSTFGPRRARGAFPKTLGRLAALAPLCAAPAHAHTGVDATHDLAFGFAHPFGGLDHLAAMVAVGWLGARQRGLWRLAPPCAFLAFMSVGAMLGELDVPPNLLQALTFNSVIVLGVMLTTSLGASALIDLFLVGGLGLLHGLAHGADAPQGMKGFLYLYGLVAATGLGHIIGFLGAFAVSRLRRLPLSTRLFGR